ncbi:3-oxoacyl-[acyl-carrier protein] reductase [Rhodococcus sp. 27YEA15]|uniref:SDR family oxidoreductase n=1 Tax=Rhodococcus sp. 27YEA15 TaxID=3156259 RepID=UPI003C7A6E68
MIQDGSNSGRVGLVSGGSRGIGAAIAGALAERGVRVGVTYRNGMVQAQNLAEKHLGRIFPVSFDLSNPDTAATAVDSVVEQWGRLDTLVLNAGQWAGGRLAEMDSTAWWEVVETNVRGTAALAHAALPHLARGQSPSIVVVSSVVGIIGHAGDTAYSSAKAALIGFSRSLAKEVARDGIRVNVLVPGFVETDMTDAVSPAAKARIEDATVLGRLGQVSEIAKAAVFLSEEATFCTGSILAVDGGWTL